MKFNLIYKERSSYEGRNNPFNVKSKTIVKNNEGYYKITYSGNYTSEGRAIYETQIDEKNIPEEYKYSEDHGYGNYTEYSLIHGHDKEIDIDLTVYEISDIPESLIENFCMEKRDKRKKILDEEIKKKPDLDYNKIVAELKLSEEEKKFADIIIDKMEKEMLGNDYVYLESYSDVIKNIDKIVKGKAVVMTHTNRGIYHDGDSLFDVEELKEDISNGSFKFSESNNYSYSKHSIVLPIDGKKIKLKDGRDYFGSCKAGGYVIDLLKNNSDQYHIQRNIYESWNNNQHSEPIIDTSLGVDRFDVKTGEMENFQEYNEKVNNKRREKRDFFYGVVEKVKEQYNISEKDVRELLNYAGSVTALNLMSELTNQNLSNKDALAMLRKNSHWGMRNVLENAGIPYPDKNFDIIQRAVSTMIQANELPKLNKNTIEKNLNLRQSDMKDVLEQISINEKDKNSMQK